MKRSRLTRAVVLYLCAGCLDVAMAQAPAWRPSPNDQTKRRIANELRREIEAQWHGVQEIVVRDFNLKDGLLKMYLKLPDGDYYESCGFHAMSQPHCDGWAVFGSSPDSGVTRWLKPYRRTALAVVLALFVTLVIWFALTHWRS